MAGVWEVMGAGKHGWVRVSSGGRGRACWGGQPDLGTTSLGRNLGTHSPGLGQDQKIFFFLMGDSEKASFEKEEG